MTDPYLFENFQSCENIPFEYTTESDGKLSPSLNKFLSSLDPLKQTDHEVNCFTSDQLQKIQHENFTSVSEKDNTQTEVYNKQNLKPVTCINCKIKGLRHQFYERFCSEYCREKYAQRNKVAKLSTKELSNKSDSKKLKINDQIPLLENKPLTHNLNYYNLEWIKQNYQNKKALKADNIKKTKALKHQCETIGCDGLGHIKGSKFTSHYTESGCPNSIKNLNKETSDNQVAKDLNYDKLQFAIMKTNFDDLKMKIALINQEQTKVKRRGRPSKNQQTRKSNQINGISKKFNKKKLKKLKSVEGVLELKEDIHLIQKKLLQDNEIKESVYLSRTNEFNDQSVKYKYNSQLLLGIEAYYKDSPNYRTWSVKEVAEFVKSIPGCGQLAQLFETQEIDGEALLLIQETDLTGLLNIKLGPAIKILNYIEKLRNLDKLK